MSEHPTFRLKPELATYAALCRLVVHQGEDVDRGIRAMLEQVHGSDPESITIELRVVEKPKAAMGGLVG